VSLEEIFLQLTSADSQQAISAEATESEAEAVAEQGKG